MINKAIYILPVPVKVLLIILLVLISPLFLFVFGVLAFIVAIRIVLFDRVRKEIFEWQTR